MQIVPGQRSGDDTATSVLATLDEAALRAVSDPWERARLATELAVHLQQLSAAALDVRRDAIHELVVKVGAARSRVARFLGVTPTRIGQLVGATTHRNRVGCRGGDAR